MSEIAGFLGRREFLPADFATRSHESIIQQRSFGLRPEQIADRLGEIGLGG